MTNYFILLSLKTCGFTIRLRKHGVQMLLQYATKTPALILTLLEGKRYYFGAIIQNAYFYEQKNNFLLKNDVVFIHIFKNKRI